VFDLPQALTLGTFVQAAYTLYLQGDPPSFVPPLGYSLIKKLYADDLADGIDLDDPDYQVFGYIARSTTTPVDVVVAIRGTQGILEWITDFDFFAIPFPFAPNAGNTERGFTNCYRTFVTDPGPGAVRVVETLRTVCSGGAVATLRLAGHSLGGALATLLALDTVANGVFPRPVVYTFASPAVGDKLFAGRYDAAVPDSWRIANRNDIIPHLPPLWAGYVHVDAEVPINSDSTTTQSLSCWHSLQTYLHTLDASRPLDAGCVP
jgi:hypothetical protein